MESSPYSSLKDSLSSVSAKALNVSSRQVIANHLDCTQLLVSEKKIARDYRGLAELVGLTYNEIKIIQESENRTMRILDIWDTRPGATLDKLIGFLEDMDRHDVIEQLTPLLVNNAASYIEYQNSIQIPIQVPEVTSGALSVSRRSNAITFDDLIYGGSTIYDAYVSYADEDAQIAQEFANFLESPKIGLKLFISTRDKLAGCAELNTNIELIQNRCRHMLILLTPNFINSPALEFQVSFAGSLAIDQKQRILVPVVLVPCEIPPIINTVSKIDFTKPHTKDWMMTKLITSLLHEEKARSFLHSIERNSLNVPHIIFNSTTSEATNNVPVITFPETAKHNVCPMDNSITYDTTAPVDISDNDKDSGACSDSIASSEVTEPGQSSSKSPSNFFKQFLSRSKKKGTVSNFSATSLSSATSGFHSQSSSSMENLENLSDFSNNSTAL